MKLAQGIGALSVFSKFPNGAGEAAAGPAHRSQVLLNLPSAPKSSHAILHGLESR